MSNDVHNYVLRPIVEEDQGLKDIIPNIKRVHIYHEKNTLANGFSKQGIHLGPSHWHVLESQSSFLLEYDLRPFI